MSTTNCPNCGAPITSWKCEYCDTVFEDRKPLVGYPPIATLLDYGVITANEARLMLMNETETLRQQCTMKDLYDQALSAMRRYGRG